MTAAPLSEKRRLLRERILRREGLAAQGPQRIPRRAGKGPAPLSFGQQRLWFLHQLDPGSAAYNLSEALRLTGVLDDAALERALAGVVRRHEVLRATFPSLDGEPVQAVASPFAPPLPRIDLGGLPADVRAATAAGLAGALAEKPFDLERGPLFRTVVLRLAAADHILFLSLHHILADGWSMGILLREITAFHAAEATGRSPALPELPLQFPDFAFWQRQELRREVLESHLRWWQERLAGAPARLELPTDHPRRAIPSPDGAFEPLHLDADLTRALHEVAERRGATLYMAVVAGLGALLQRYTDQDDLLVGTVAAGRQRPELEGLIGFFVNTLVLRLDLSGDPDTRGLLDRIREVMLSSDAHQDLPFEELVKLLEPSRDPSHNPFFSVMLSFQNLPPAAASPPAGVSLERFPFRRKAVQFDLHFDLAEGPRGLTGSLGYRAALFESATVRQLVRSFEVMLAGMARQTGLPVSELPLLSEAESLQLATAWNRPTACRTETTLDRLFAATVENSPRALALSCAEQHLTYRELDEKANRLARRLRLLGAGPGTRVGLRVERSAAMVVGILGILKAGGAYVPFDPDLPAERLAFLTADAGVRLLLTEAEILDPGLASEDPGPLAPSALPHDAAYVIYTSGSTGRPKGVVVTHANVARLLTMTQPWFGFGPDDVWTLFHSYAFDFSVWEIWGALGYGGRLVVVPWEVSRSPVALLELLAQERVTVLNQTPSAFRPLSRAEETGAPGELCLRWIIFGGEALELPSLAPWIARHGDERPRLVNMYGITETTVHVTFRRITRADVAAGRGSVIGQPIPDLQVHVLDRQLRPVPFLAPGEICVGGPGLARGYLGRPELTAERFVPDPWGPLFGEAGARLYRSGDLARRRPDGDLEYLGRRDQQVKVRGFRIELREIEALLAGLPGVREAVVLAREDRSGPSEAGDRRLVAYVVGDAAAGTLRQALRERLPEYMVPSAFVALAALPLTSNGKLDRKALPAPEWQSPAESFRAPRTPVEEVLAGIWAEILKLDRVGVADHFFELGGHSLLATQVMSRLRSVFGVETPLRALFEAPVLADLAARVEQALRAGEGLAAPPLVSVAPELRQGGLPLSFAQQRLWFIDRLQPGTPVYNIPVALRLEGPLDSAVLALCLGEIVRRHEALRTVFTAPEGSPVQVIQPPAPFALPVVDLSELPENRREALASDLAGEEGGRGFDLTRGPLLRGLLLRLGEEDHVTALTLHHIASDGWSMGLLVREVTALYAAFVDGRPSPLPELPLQYADFAVWQRSWLQGDTLEKEISFWRRQLAGLPPRLELLTDRPRPAAQSFRGASRPVRLPDRLVRQAHALGRQEGATLFMVLLAGFQALLARSSGQKDLAVGTPVSGRNRMETERLIGFFVNTLVLRGDLTEEPSFRELLGRVRETALAAHTHQEVPFEKLVQELAPERSLAHAPLFQVMFSLQNAPVESLEMRSLRLRPVSRPGTTAKFDLTLDLAEWNGWLVGGLEHATDLFETPTIDRLILHFERLLAGALESPATPLSGLSLLTDAEHSQVAVEWNDTACPFAGPACLHHLIAQQAARVPAAEAIVDEGHSLTFGELGRRASGLARRLDELGVGPEVPVVLFLDRSVEAIVAIVGVLAAGGAYVPLDPAYPAERVAWVLEDTRTPLVITASGLAGRLPAGTRTLLVEEVEESAEAFDGGAGPDNPAYVIYTSGSTGRPKGVVVSHASMLSFARALRETVYRGATGPLRVALNASFSFDASVQQIAQLAWGDSLHVLPRSVRLDPAALVDSVRRHRLDVLDCTPSQLRLLLQAGLGEGDAAPAIVLVGGEVVDADLRDAALSRTRTRFWNVYGPTECTVDSTAGPFVAGGPASRIGLPLPNVRVHIVAGLGGLASLGMPGELQVGGAGLARGYLNRPDLTAERFVPDLFGEAGGRLYRTGDLVRWLPDGSLDYLGRMDHQIKLRGFRIELDEVEAALRSLPGIQEAVVMVRESRERGPELVACVVAAGGAMPEPSELRRSLSGKLPDYMLPSAYACLEGLPVSPSGKLDRQALDQWAASAQTTSAAAYRPPLDPVEIELGRIWEQLLSVDRVGLDDDFFHLGGHSLLAVSLIAQVEQRLGLRLPIAALFQGATLGRLARVLKEEAHRSGDPDGPVPLMLVPLRAPGDAPPWFFVHPVGGQVHWYLELARSLPAGIPAFGLQAPGLENPGLVLDDLPTIAGIYLSAVRAAQPQGPYFLAGWSAGGVIAFEMARALRAQGQTVGAIVLIDTLVHARPRAEAVDDEISHWIDMISHLTRGAIDHEAWREALLARDHDQRLAHVAAELTGRGLLPAGLGKEYLQRMLGVFLATLEAVRSYEPAPCPGTGTLVWAAATDRRHDDASLDWASLFEEGCEVHDLPGNHYSILSNDRAEALAAVFAGLRSNDTRPSGTGQSKKDEEAKELDFLERVDGGYNAADTPADPTL